MSTSTPHPPLPPGQQLVAAGKWPLVGERAAAESRGPWQLEVHGAVATPHAWTLDELHSLPTTTQTVDIHCVTRWSKLGVNFTGVRLADVLDLCHPTADARFVSFVARSTRDHSTSLPLAEAVRAGALLAWASDGAALADAHGGPLRGIVPGRYFYKSLKWLKRIELLASDRPGYWESVAGYHNEADPWREQRYMAPTLDKRQLATLLAARDFSGHDLRSLDARGHDLTGLRAEGSLLRDANFRDALLAGAVFSRANLSNAHFEGADLRGAGFLSADVEGASFVGADLREADFRGATLTAATFTADNSTTGAATIDSTTQFDLTALDALMPAQQAFVLRLLKG